MLEDKDDYQDFVALLSDEPFQTLRREPCDETAYQDRDKTYPVEYVVPDVDGLNNLTQVPPRDV